VKHATVVLTIALFALTFAFGVRADGETTDTLFANAVAALNRGAFDEAIDGFELLADRGLSHPDASYDRAIAYVRRAESHGARSGDLGHAAAALGETLEFRPDDADARVALERVHQEIVRRRARVHARDVELRPSLGWALVGLLEEDSWAALALGGSLVLSLGLAAWWLGRGPSRGVRVAGVAAASLGALTLVTAGTLAGLARYDRLHVRPAVLVVEEAHLLDENGVTISGAGTVVPEGASLRVTDQKGALARVEWGTIDGWLSLGQIHLLARP
jgi:hypothetical protein